MKKKRTVQPKEAIPRSSHPREPTRAPLASKEPVLWASGLVLAALAAAAFAVTLMLTQPVHSIPNRYVHPSASRHVRPAARRCSYKSEPVCRGQPQLAPPQVVTPPTAQQHTADVDLKPFDKLQIKQASLSAVLQIMSAKSGIKIEPAPRNAEPERGCGLPRHECDGHLEGYGPSVCVYCRRSARRK